MSDQDAPSVPSSEASPPNQRLRAVVHGDVQGVGFRAYTLREALRLGLTGWVRNTWDGTVEAVAEGPPTALSAFERALHNGPPAADVDRVDTAYTAASGEFRGFHIRY